MKATMFEATVDAALLCAALAAALFAAPAPARSAPLTAQEQAGRVIFEKGESPSGDRMTARLGAGDVEVPASAVPCGSCHGRDGIGRPEGGVRPPSIRWSELTKTYGHAHERDRKHPAFTEATVAEAIARGFDPAGNELDRTMPRYTLSERDMKSLVAYLKQVEFQTDPGIGAKTLRVGTVLPSAGRFGELGGALKGLLEAQFDGLNRKGGLYGRRLELVVADYGASPEQARANAAALLREGDVFLLLAPFSAGWEADLGRMAADSRTPVVAPLTLFPEDTRASNLYVFHLLSGVGELVQTLGEWGGRSLDVKRAPGLLLHPQTEPGTALARGAAERLREKGWEAVVPSGFTPGGFDPAGFVREGKARAVASVFVLGGGVDIGALARAAAEVQWYPYLLVPGPLAPRDILELPDGFAGRVYLAYPTLPADQKPGALGEYAAIFQSGSLARTHQTLQVPAYAGALAMEEALRRAGRELSREKFIAAFEAFQGFDTGMLPPLSYNSNRRIGSLGGYVVAVDLRERQFRPVGGFVGAE